MVVVERSADAAAELQTVADRLHVEMVLCESMSGGFAQLLRLQPHIAVVDATLCDLGGIGAARAARILAPECEVILTSLDPTSDVGLEAIQAGALECVMAGDSLTRVRVHLSRLRVRLRRNDYVMHGLEDDGAHRRQRSRPHVA